MSLTSALYTGVSGLSATGNSMQIIGDNIANSNSVGFKSGEFTFEDALNQSISTQSGISQIGRGTAISDVSNDFTQGSLQSTGNATDLAIGGEGFFMVSDPMTGNDYFTRAGNFDFDRFGNLVNPDGLIVQGWELDDSGQPMGTIDDISLESFTSPPKQTSSLTAITNLYSEAESNCADLAAAWDPAAAPPMGSENYEYQTTIPVYDSLGSQHDVTVYYDKVPGSTSSWEYIITCSPEEDKRAGFDSTAYDGLLGSGTIEFSESSGNITGLEMSSVDPATGVWTPETLNSEGYYEFSANFLGGSAPDSEIVFDVGTRHDGVGWENGSSTTTQYASSSSTVYQSANGYGTGDLQNIEVDAEGVITGVYSNGQSIPLYQVALADFTNTQGLYEMGGGLFQETMDSGVPITSVAGSNGLGSIAPNSLEQSNVDIAEEFSNMIIIQRTYQGNSKIITTVDSMLSDVINMKR